MKRSSSLALLALVLAVGCSRADDDSPPTREPCACASAAQVVDPTLLAFLSKARAAHHQADLAEDAGENAKAVQVLEALVRGPRPGGTPPPPEVAEVLADTRARLADLKSTLGDFDAATREIDGGLELAAVPTHFRGRLFEVRGLVEERREKALRAAGNTSGADLAHQAAIKAFEQAIAIQDEVIVRALSDAGAP